MKRFLIIPIMLVFGCSPSQEPAQVTSESTPEQKDGLYQINIQNQTLLIDPSTGGRIASLKIGSKDFFTGKAVNADNWGSTFWTSPQSAWGWPPSEEIDKKEYSAKIEGDKIVLTSQKDSKLGYVIKKEISGNHIDTSFTIIHTITNNSDSTQKVAPWEITRVSPNGLTFYPTGNGDKRGDLAPLTKDSAGISWFNYPATIPGEVPKLLADGKEGWMAQANNGLLFVKEFSDVPTEKIAPGEGEIEIYVNPDKSYIEIEQQGAYEEIKPGASKSWEVKWYLRSLPENVEAVSGNEKLVNLARELAK